MGLIERLGALDLTTLLVYRVDSAPADALPLLAWQFDILEPQWQLGVSSGESVDSLQNIDILTNIDALTSPGCIAGVSDAESWRALLRAAIPLHRSRGTPYAIRTALASLGWPSVVIQEGQNSWAGTSYPSSQGWAVFRVILNVAGGQGVQPSDVARIASAVAFFKPSRAWLDSIWFELTPVRELRVSISDSVVSIFSQNDSAPFPLDTPTAAGWTLNDLKTIAPLHDRRFYYGGISYGVGEPIVADSGVTVLGQPIAPAR